MDAANPDFAPDSFDQIISIEAAFHFNTRAQFIKNAYEILKPGGSITFTDILFNDTDAVGSWSVPESNRITDLTIYNQQCVDPGFKVVRQYDITEISWAGFCNHISKFPGMQKMAEKLLPSVSAYIFTQLEKPAR
jgi:cyclopropane fatty-acyl-phospholipid synthase-like methyltransferase